MTTPKYIISIDFGSAYIRVAKTRMEAAQSDNLLPQLVEFNGERNLANAILLNSELTGYEEIGQDVFINGLSESSDLIFSGITLNETVAARVAAQQQILQYIYQTLELDRLTDAERTAWATVVGLPPESKESSQHVAALKAANFPDVRALPAAMTILYGTLNSTPRPGHYLVVDCGADYTHLTLCHVEASQTTTIDSRYGRPGGRDFDRVLTHHFSNLLAESTILSSPKKLELMHFVEEFKKTFAQEWKQGGSGIEYVYPVPSEQVVLSLQKDDFIASTLAGELIAEFRNLAERLLLAHPEIKLDGIFLAGGGAHWQFVVEWAVQKVGQNKVYRSEYPEESLVRGLPLLATSGMRFTSSAPIVPRPADPPRPGSTAPSHRKSPSQPPTMPQSRMSPWTVFWLEFLGGLFGFMGLGWFFGVKNLPLGCGGLLGWWVILGVLLILSITALLNPLLLLCVIPVWFGAPLLSAIFAYQAQTNRH